MNSEDFKKTYDSIRLLGEQAHELFSAASSHIKSGVEILAKEFDYEFVDNEKLRNRLNDSCERMLLARTGFVHPNADVAFEDFSRNVHLQLEGLTNCWFNQFFLKENNLTDFPYLYVEIKLKQQLTLQFKNGVFASKFDVFGNALADAGLLPADFINTYLSQHIDEVEALYSSIFRSAEISFQDFKSKVRKPPMSARQTVEKLDFSFKVEYIYLYEKGIRQYFTNHPIVRLNEFRNALIAHMGAGLEQGTYYYKELVSKPDRQRILVESFVTYYETVRKRLS